MSTIAVNAITDADGGNTASINGATPTTDNTMGRNRVINGAMEIAQRGTSAVTGSGEFPVDRFLVGNTTDGAFSAQQDSSAPAGFINSVKLTTTTIDSSLTTTQFYSFQHRIEGTNVSDLGWGTANAKTVTLSFWVRSSLTGTFGGALRNSANDRSYPFTYSISAADTWEQKSITIVGDTSGTWLTTTGIGIRVFFGLGSGPDFSGTAGAWAGASYVSATGATSVIGTLNATWYITGVQLEVGSVATSFERRSYGQELALCQRYYQRTTQNGSSSTAFVNGAIYDSTNAYGVYHFKTTMRAAPSGSASSTNALNVYAGDAAYASSNVVFQIPNSDQSEVRVTISGATPGHGAFMRLVGTNSWIDFSAEL